MLRRLLGPRLTGLREAANELVDGLDDRARLLVLELAVERRRLARLAVVVLAALVVGIIANYACVAADTFSALVWAAATVVALTWDTPWRAAALLGLLAFWILFALALALKARSLLKAGDEAFRLSRQVAGDDVARIREALR